MTESDLIMRPFFGGSIRCFVPSTWKDLSSVRQVPDNQECFYDTGYLLAIEILERQEIPDDAAALFFFNDLAETNESSASEFDGAFTSTIPSLALPTAIICSGRGSQHCPTTKMHGLGVTGEEHIMSVELCVIRLQEQQTDLLISLSSRSEFADPNHFWDSTDLFQKITQSFEIIDWTLFV